VKKTLTLIRLRLERLWSVMLIISAVGTAAGFAWWEFNFLDMEGDERNAYDDGLQRFNAKWWFPWGKPKVSEDIVLVGIDQATFDDIGAFEPWNNRYGSWPYDRIIWKDVVDYLDEAGAKLVVFDVTLTEPKPDPTGDKKFGESLEAARVPTMMGFGAVQLAPPLGKVDKPVNRLHKPKLPTPASPPRTEKEKEETFDEFPTDPTPEEAAKAKAEALSKLRGRAATAFAFPVQAEGGIEVATFEPASTIGLADGGTATGADLQRDAGLMAITLPRHPVPAEEWVIDAIGGFGSVELEADDDGKMRQTRFVYTDGENDYLTLPLAAAADYFQAESITYAPGRLQIGEHTVRINADGSARINYQGALDDRFRSSSLVDLLRYRTADKGSDLWREGAARFKDKIVFIGAIAQGTGDQHPTPFNANEPGVMKHMAVLDNILNDDFIREAPIWASLLLAFLVALFSVALVMVAQSFVTDVGAPVFLTFAFFVVTGMFITFTDIHVLSAMPGMAGTLAALGATAYNRFLASKDREFLREAFSSYVDPDVLDDLVEQRRLPPLDGEEREVTAFFSDIRGFSTFTEQLKGEPRKLMKLLHDYLSAVTPVLKDHGACIDKYIGDAVVALFGAPHAMPDHALNACRAALAVQKTIAQLRTELAAQGLPDVYTRIGLNTDVMLVGNIGSKSRPINYTAIGDGMNLAARLEGVNKVYETLILIGPKTYEAVKAHLVTRELDSVRVAGKHEATTVYELVGEEEQVAAAKRQVLDLYAKALELYRHRRFPESLRALKEAYDIDKTDGPTKVLAAKCNHFMQHPPPADWDGVTQLEK
jgi:adenylate cyclase